MVTTRGPPPRKGAWDKVVLERKGVVMGLGSGVRLSWIETLPFLPTSSVSWR